MIEGTINWFNARKGRVTYSMINRNGPNSYDCSSAVYYALKESGGLPHNINVGNTDSLFGDLERNGWVMLQPDANGNVSTQRGDIFIWGGRGTSSGAAGHTGVFIDSDNIIHCSYGYNGIHVDNHDWLWAYNGSPIYNFYRYVGNAPAPNPEPQPSSEKRIRFDRIYNVDDIQFVNNMWQVYTQALAPVNFAWDDNGIPAAPLVQVDSDGFRTQDQDFNTSRTYKVPGNFRVEDETWDSSVLYYLVTIGGYGVWVDSGAVIITNDSTPEPTFRPVETQAPETRPPAANPPESQPPITPIPETPAPQPETTAPETQPPEILPQTKPPKENTNVAFSKEDKKELKIATERIQNLANDVAGSDIAEDITESIPKKVKVGIYIFGDTLIGLGLLIPTAAVAIGTNMSAEQIVAASSTFATAGTFMLTMFGIYKSGKKNK